MTVETDELRIAKLQLKPGDTLVVQVSENWSPEQIKDMADYLGELVRARYDAKVLMVPGPVSVIEGSGGRLAK